MKKRFLMVLLLCLLLTGCVRLSGSLSDYQTRRETVTWLPELTTMDHATYHITYRDGLTANAVQDVLKIQYDEEQAFEAAKESVFSTYRFQTQPLPDGQTSPVLINGYVIWMLSQSSYNLQWPQRTGFVAVNDSRQCIVYLSLIDPDRRDSPSMEQFLRDIYDWR